MDGTWLTPSKYIGNSQPTMYSLTATTSMQNYLAEEVMNSDMVQLMLACRQSKGEDRKKFDAAIDFLSVTLKIVEIFRDHRPVKSQFDSKLVEFQSADEYFWERSRLGQGQEGRKELMSEETRMDLDSSSVGFIHLVSIAHQISPSMSITLAESTVMLLRTSSHSSEVLGFRL